MMPLSVATKLGITKFEKTDMRMIMADRSVRLPVGLVKDFPVLVKGHEVPTDFVVLELDGEPKNPIVFGRPFLATAKAKINVHRGKMKLNLGKDKTLEFGVYKKNRKPTVEGKFFGMEEMSSSDDEWEDAFNDFPYEGNDESLGTTRVESSYQFSFKENPKEEIKILEKKKKVPRRHKNKGLIPLQKELVYHYGEESLALDGSSLQSIFSLKKDEKAIKNEPKIKNNKGKAPTSSKAPIGEKAKLPKVKLFSKPTNSSTMVLRPKEYKDGWIEYKIKSGGNGKPFAKVRAFVGKEKLGEDGNPPQELLKKVIKLKVEDSETISLSNHQPKN